MNNLLAEFTVVSSDYTYCTVYACTQNSGCNNYYFIELLLSHLKIVGICLIDFKYTNGH